MILARLHGYARTYLAGILAAKTMHPITVNGCAIYCVAVSVAGAAGKPVFSTFRKGAMYEWFRERI